MTTTDEPLRLPPDEAWIERRITPVAVNTGTATRQLDGHPTGDKRIEGTLRGAWPNHGATRNIPSTDHDIWITDVDLIVHANGTVSRGIS